MLGGAFGSGGGVLVVPALVILAIGAVLVQDLKPAPLARLFSLFPATRAERLWMSV